MTLPRSLADSLGLSVAEEQSILKDMAILARVKSSASRGMVILEIEKAMFDTMVERLAEKEGVDFTVRWEEDEMGFAAPTVYRVEKTVDEG